MTDQNADYACRHCGAGIIHVPGHSGRYRFTDRLDGTDIFGSGSECPKNERGHDPAQSVCLCGVVKVNGEPTDSRNWYPDCPVHPWSDALQAQADSAVKWQRRARAARAQIDSSGA